MKKTKVVASIGPSSYEYDSILNLVLSGVDVFRINLVYTNYNDCSEVIKRIRKVSNKLNKIIGIMLDIKGPCIRIDKLVDDNIYLVKDKEIRFYDYHVVSNNTQISTSCSNLTHYVNLDDIIYIADGEVSLKVISINKDNFICKVITEGVISSNQSLTIKNFKNKLPYIDNIDKENILYAISQDIDFLGLSYVRDEQDILSVVDLLIENNNEHMSLIGKIENEDAFINLKEILKVADGVMVARGDLGINCSLEKLPFYQKEILKLASDNQKIGLVATDFLKSMTDSIVPTRAEVSDIYNAVFDKCDGLVLCDETSIGKNILECVKVMIKVIEEAEKNFPYQNNLEDTFKQGRQDITSTISYSVVDSSILLNASCILANTLSGYTARKISYFRPISPILGLSPSINTAKSLTLNYGVIPVLVKKFSDTDKIISECINKYKEIMDYKIGDIVIITGGLPLNNKNTDFMKIEKIVD